MEKDINFNEFDVLIKTYEKKVEILKKCKYYYNYFKKAKNCKNSYLVELRTKIGKELYAMGANLSEVGRAIGRNHCTVIHNRKTSAHRYIEDIVEENAHYWIENNLYPSTLSLKKYNQPCKVTFKLVKKDD
ncbi:MAG: hypothetical protein RLZZ196_1257 [Bacteroidota bacterium]|jgi:hypothetical protein